MHLDALGKAKPKARARAKAKEKAHATRVVNSGISLQSAPVLM